ncbi:hypothetical protein ERJ75_000413600 [Trypanosoma vivax]|nr:hypothetical protein ERJ75_000413600 [Trypanosoma vivax]
MPNNAIVLHAVNLSAGVVTRSPGGHDGVVLSLRLNTTVGVEGLSLGDNNHLNFTLMPVNFTLSVESSTIEPFYADTIEGESKLFLSNALADYFNRELRGVALPFNTFQAILTVSGGWITAGLDDGTCINILTFLLEMLERGMFRMVP